MRRGEIHWHRFARPDKRRPVLVLTRSSLVGHLTTVTVAALSRTIRDVASEVVVGPEHGLPARCAANLHNVFTLQQRTSAVTSRCCRRRSWPGWIARWCSHSESASLWTSESVA